MTKMNGEAGTAVEAVCPPCSEDGGYGDTIEGVDRGPLRWELHLSTVLW